MGIKGNEYMFRVKAVNKYGESKPLESDCVEAKDNFSKPGEPGKPTLVSATAESLTICWYRPNNDGGSDIDCYHIEKRNRDSPNWVRVSSKHSISELHHKVTGLRKGTMYEFRVAAENKAGIGSWSDQSEAFLVADPTYPPAAP